MADDQTANQPVTGFPDVTANNADVKAKLEGQNLDGKPATDAELQSSGDALDALAKSIVEDKEKAKAAPVEPVAADPVTPAEPTAPAAPVETPEAIAKREEEERVKKSAEDLFKDAPTLPPNASPKSTEAFASIKIRAAQAIAEREQRLEAAQKKLQEAEERLKNMVPADAVKELEDHRKWRAKLDVEADPKFKEFDKEISTNHEFIYAQLRKSPVITPEVIEKIKANGGPENVKLDKIFEAVKDPTLQRIVEAKVAEIEQTKWRKEEAIKSAKTNIDQYLAEQQKDYSERATAHNKKTEALFSQYSGNLNWFKEKPVDPKADEPTRKAAEAHNAMVKEIHSQVREALNDDSPEMRAIMLTATAQLVYLQKIHDANVATLASTKKALDDANAKLAKYSNASRSRLQETAAPSTPNTVKPKTEADIFHTRADDALDALAKDVMEKRGKVEA